MIDQIFAFKQIRRMGGLDGYPRYEPEALAEITTLAGRLARSEDHLRAVIDGIIELATVFPKPSELRKLLDRGREETVNLSCPLCGGSGWKIVERDGVSGAARCVCGSVPRPPGESPFSIPNERRTSGGLTKIEEKDWLH